MKLAWFITPHGYGHATRALAIMSALRERDPKLAFAIFTRVRESLFRETLVDGYTYHACDSDIGLVQTSSLVIDHRATLERLDQMLPFSESFLTSLADHMTDCAAIVCDIAPVGIALATKLCLPSILISNFTWDWIYEDYLARFPAYRPFVAQFRELFSSSEYHIQTEPNCKRTPGTPLFGPAARPRRQDADEIRTMLGGDERKRVLITMGGVGQRLAFGQLLARRPDCLFLVPDQVHLEGDNVRRIEDGTFYHPDLVAAVDGVIGKLGYSTIAELWQAGTPFGYIGRPDYRESKVMAGFVAENLPSVPMPSESFEDGSLLDALDALLRVPRAEPKPNAAPEIADALMAILH